MTAYVHNEKQGREHLSHPAWLGHWGKEVLDWAWEDREKTPATYDAAGREQDVATTWWTRLLAKGSFTNDLLRAGPSEANALHALQSLYLFAREKWRPGFTAHEGGPGVVAPATFGR